MAHLTWLAAHWSSLLHSWIQYSSLQCHDSLQSPQDADSTPSIHGEDDIDVVLHIEIHAPERQACVVAEGQSSAMEKKTHHQGLG